MLSLIENLPLHVHIFAAVLGILVLDFLLRFFIPSLVVWSRLSSAIRNLRRLDNPTQDNIGKIFQKRGPLQQLWKEYAGSLHQQTETDPETGHKKSCFRSTMPAETFFKTDIIVDTPLKADFFRHLPGIFTGIGIIGTFSGLLIGLHAFQVSENPTIVRDSLGSLLHGVSMAFIVSAAAITLAMIVTFIEKRMLTSLYARVEKLAHLLDNLFVSGVGEEYLARLVKASESSSSQITGLKDALASEIRQAITEQTEKQIAAIHLLGHTITSGIETTLKQPMENMAESISSIRIDQSGAVRSLMQDLLNSFNEQLGNQLHDQITGINTIQQQTLISLQGTMTRLENLVTHIESAGEKGTAAMGSQLAAAMAGADARQQVMNDRMREFVEQLTQAVSQSQNATQAQLQQTLDEIANQMGAMIESLTTQISTASDAGWQRQKQIAEESKNAISGFGSQVEYVIDGIGRAVEEMKTAVNAMRHTTSTTVSRLDDSAGILHAASNNFAQSGIEISNALGKTSDLVLQFSHASDSIKSLTEELAKILSDYQQAREATISLIESLRLVTDKTRHETTITSDMLMLIENATTKLVNAQKEADDYLGNISKIIEEAHHIFTTGMVRAVDETNHEFHETLTGYISLLRIGIQELTTTVEEIATARQTWTTISK